MISNVSQDKVISFLASGSWLSQVPEAYAQGSRLVGLSSPQPAVRITLGDTCASSAGLALQKNVAKPAEGTPMMRKAHGDRHLRIIGRPSLSHATSGGRPANDALVTSYLPLAHHWQAVALVCERQRRPANDAQAQ